MPEPVPVCTKGAGEVNYSPAPRLLLALKPFGTAHDKGTGKARFIKRDAELKLTKIEEIDPLTNGGNVVFQLDGDDRLFGFTFGDSPEQIRAVLADLLDTLLANPATAQVLNQRRLK